MAGTLTNSQPLDLDTSSSEEDREQHRRCTKCGRAVCSVRGRVVITLVGVLALVFVVSTLLLTLYFTNEFVELQDDVVNNNWKHGVVLLNASLIELSVCAPPPPAAAPRKKKLTPLCGACCCLFGNTSLHPAWHDSRAPW